MEFEDNVPIYLQIVVLIKKRIIQGLLKPGDKIPSVRELAEEVKVNPNTISRAYQELERDKITETKRGMGTFISGDENMMEVIRSEFSASMVTRFIRDMRETGFSDEEILKLLASAINTEGGK
jgi:GntR family transcriptional regulator